MPTRRQFLAASAAPLAMPAAEGSQVWLGTQYWANRFEDWRRTGDRIECIAPSQGLELRTAALLTYEILPKGIGGDRDFTISVTTALNGGEMTGFLIGAGGPDLDWRAGALVQRASGEGGGLLACYHADGTLAFREHTNEEQPLAWAPLVSHSAPARKPGEEVTLTLKRMAGSLIFQAGRHEVAMPYNRPGSGIALVATGPSHFRGVEVSGPGIAARPERAIGPVLGSMYSINKNVLKLSAQFMPVGLTMVNEAELRIDGVKRATATISRGFVAAFRLADWDSTREAKYEVAYDGRAVWSGTIQRDPGSSRPLRIALLNCIMPSVRSLDQGPIRKEMPQAELIGRYTHKSLYFPHTQLVENVAKQKPDLLVFSGDQIYEGSPTRRENGESPSLDYLYKWSLFLWSVRELTRNIPCVVQTDDHDVYHGNLWGNGGRKAPDRDPNRGGYRCTGEWVNMVQETQCAHNPDPYDPTPVDQGINCYYCAFEYGGVSFALLEDRKFKTAAVQGQDLDVHEAELLGERQEKFLEEWSRNAPGLPKISLTQTVFACVQTSPTGKSLLDFDANGFPKLGRDRAVVLLKKAGAIALAGDQHLSTLVIHGLDRYDDGILQFAAPAGASSWQRWWQPAKPAPNGEFMDAFGNKVRVLAVANPKITFAEYREHNKGRGQGLGDRKLKSEGFGIVVVDHKAKSYTIECWPHDGGPQFKGWPFRWPFPKRG
ncbi:MAG: alkaline phosphatase D family protein [Bryobacteraceae bacterium]|nr:alkaline phosphatase D family protein [Bryobacteraceae bacterium]